MERLERIEKTNALKTLQTFWRAEDIFHALALEYIFLITRRKHTIGEPNLSKKLAEGTTFLRVPELFNTKP